MVSISTPLPELSHCQTFCTTDQLVGNVLVFVTISPPNSSFSGVEAHILTCAGLHSYKKITLAPSSALYAAVQFLPVAKQGSEVHRGLAVAINKYFSELSIPIKDLLVRKAGFGNTYVEIAQPGILDERHAAFLATKLQSCNLSESVYKQLAAAFAERYLSNIDLDIVLWGQTAPNLEEVPEEMREVLALFGDESFLPTTRLKRQLSKHASKNAKPVEREYREGVLREIQEFSETEQNYVRKLEQFLEMDILPLKARARQGAGPEYPTEEELEQLFPESLIQIIEENARFAEDLHQLQTGNIGAFAECCLLNFPNFRQPYDDYLQASAQFPQVLARFTKSGGSSFSKRVENIGEQRLRSMLIEPVQRLPRYSLYIDNMLSQLPPEHPAVQKLSDARDIITEICSLQTNASAERNQTVQRLQTMIPLWPARLRPTGRLISAIDCQEVLPPFADKDADVMNSMLLLFPDCLVLLRRPKSSSPNGRAVLAEVDRPPGPAPSGRPTSSSGSELVFAGWADLAHVKVAESQDNTFLWINFLADLRDSWEFKLLGAGSRKIILHTNFEGRASKVAEEIAKAKLERRVQDMIGIREVKEDGLSAWAGIWGDEWKWRSFVPKTSVVVFVTDELNGPMLRDELYSEVTDGVEVAVLIATGKGKLGLEMRSYNDYTSSDLVAPNELLLVLFKRLCALLHKHTHPQHPPLARATCYANEKLLRSLNIAFDGESRLSKVLRPASPVKMISAFLGSGQAGGSSPGKRPQSIHLTENLMLPPTSRPERGNSRNENRGSPTYMAGAEGGNISGELKRLEVIFEGFVMALKFHSGQPNFNPSFANIYVDEVDELHLEMMRTINIEAAKRAAFGTTFGAFLKFMRNDWKEKMGVLISKKGVDELLENSDAMYLQDFEQYLSAFLSDFSSQNRRAFRSVVRLLSHLMSKTENADDKGTLVAAFTDLLLEEELDALDYLPLVDRLVEDVDTLFSEMPAQSFFGDAVPMGSTPSTTPVPGSRRGKIIHSASHSSVSSSTSLRKRFGLSMHGSLRDNRSNGQDISGSPGKASSIWRTLSKGHNKTQSQDSINIKANILRTKSIERVERAREQLTMDRPTSREKPPPLHGLFQPPPVSANSRPLSTIIDMPQSTDNLKPPLAQVTPRRKRRSSLSDLTAHPEFKNYQNEPVLPLSIGPKIVDPKRPSRQTPTTPPQQTVQPSNPNTPHGLRRDASFVSDTSKSSSSRPGTQDGPEKKSENVRPRRPTLSRDSRPDRPLSGSSSQKTPRQNGVNRLRERAQTELQTMNSAAADLEEELDKIGAELKSISSSSRSRPQQLGRSNTINTPQLNPTSAEDLLPRLQNKIRALEKRIPDVEEQRVKFEKLNYEFERALRKKDEELKETNRLLVDASTENELLYERYNDELAKINARVKNQKGGEQAEILKILKELKSDMGRVKRENLRLRREIVQIKSQYR